MKKVLLFGLAIVLLVSMLIAGCSKKAATSIELSLDDFSAQNNIVKDVQLAKSDSLSVTLGSNASTGYLWGDATIGDNAVITQASYKTVAATTNLAGAPGKEVWTFDAKATGTTTIKFSYSRPWEGGEKDTFTLTLNITVK